MILECRIYKQIPQETEIINHDDLVVQFLAKMMDFTPQQMHFFDESSVIYTSGKQKVGRENSSKSTGTTWHYLRVSAPLFATLQCE